MQNIEFRINELIDAMTLAEKCRMCHAVSRFTSGGVERLNISGLSMSDGPHGVRKELAEDSWIVTFFDTNEARCVHRANEQRKKALFKSLGPAGLQSLRPGFPTCRFFDIYSIAEPSKQKPEPAISATRFKISP